MALDRMPLVVFGSSMEFGARVVMTALVLTILGTKGVYFIEIASWWASGIFYFVTYYIVIRKINLNVVLEERR